LQSGGSPSPRSLPDACCIGNDIDSPRRRGHMGTRLCVMPPPHSSGAAMAGACDGFGGSLTPTGAGGGGFYMGPPTPRGPRRLSLRRRSSSGSGDGGGGPPPPAPRARSGAAGLAFLRGGGGGVAAAACGPTPAPASGGSISAAAAAAGASYSSTCSSGLGCASFVSSSVASGFSISSGTMSSSLSLSGRSRSGASVVSASLRVGGGASAGSSAWSSLGPQFCCGSGEEEACEPGSRAGAGACMGEDADVVLCSAASDECCSTCCSTSDSGCAWVLSRFGGREVLADYEFGVGLGRGTFGVTRLVTERVSARPFACKTVCKERINSRQYIEDMRSEVSILQHLIGVPGVVQLRGAYEDCRSVNLVLELCAGGDLLDHILRLGRLPEEDAAAAARAIVLALQRCHARGVAHRDVKPENFLLAADGCAASCRVSDFGVSAFFEPGQKFREVVGTPYYMAPEVLLRCYDQVGWGWGRPMYWPCMGVGGCRGGVCRAAQTRGLGAPRPAAMYQPAEAFTRLCLAALPTPPPQPPGPSPPQSADIWSAGVILYLMLSGTLPFMGSTDRHVCAAVLHGAIATEGSPWAAVSEGAKSVVRRMLCRDPRARATPEELLAHPWLAREAVVVAVAAAQATQPPLPPLPGGVCAGKGAVQAGKPPPAPVLAALPAGDADTLAALAAAVAAVA
jgi:serine/threonine protein kinase